MAVTVITHHVLRDDTAAREWDAAMYERLSAARSQHGWIGGQLLRAINDRMLRTIVGTWESRERVGGLARRRCLPGDPGAARWTAVASFRDNVV